MLTNCSNGVGRPGTLIAARYLIDHLESNPQNVDIVGTVLALRKWRRGLVQSYVSQVTTLCSLFIQPSIQMLLCLKIQLEFLYNFVAFCLEKLGIRNHPIASPDVSTNRMINYLTQLTGCLFHSY